MKITGIRTTPLALPFKEPYHWAGRVDEETDMRNVAAVRRVIGDRRYRIALSLCPRASSQRLALS